ncbi:MAG TPA: hypothetical protein VF546_16170 [Pyrinomonadaceae bacterium]|jgi:hypothetical protein
MKPLTSEAHDAEALQELGRASVQVIHDLKNQINGLKLYATFLRKRLEKTGGREDELETVAKLSAGLERAAADLTALVRYGRPVELRRARVELGRALAAALEREPDEPAAAPCYGDFDQATLVEALKAIDASVRAQAPGTQSAAGGARAAVSLRRDETTRAAVIEWRGAQGNGSGGDAGDPFNSFAGSHGLRLALAAKLIRAHGGALEQDGGTLRVRLPLTA